MKIRCKPITFGIGHRDPDSPYNRFKSAIKKEFFSEKIKTGKICVHAIVYLTKSRSDRNDLDNFAKPIVDALHESRVFLEENQIYKLILEKVEVGDSTDEGVSILLASL